MCSTLKSLLSGCTGLLILFSLNMQANSQQWELPQGSHLIQVMPDTVDLARSADLAMNALTRCTNPNDNYSVYFNGNITINPVRLVGHQPDSVVHWKLTEPLLLLRTMTGNRANLEVDRAWTRSLDQIPAHIESTHPVHLGRGLAGVAVLYALTGDEHWKTLGIRIVDRLNEFCVRQNDFAYFPVIMHFLVDPTRTIALEDYHEPFPTGWPAMHDAWLVEGLVAFHHQSDYRPALELAGRLARHMRHHGNIFDKDGGFIAAHNGYQGPRTAIHFHRHTNVLLALLDYAIAADEREYAEFAWKGYQFARSHGNAHLGFFPEYLPGSFPDDRNGIIDCEGCCVADMTLLALNLSLAGVADCWDDVDRYTRNMLTEMQLKSAAEIEQQADSLPSVPIDPTKEDAHQAAQRLVGSFAGWGGPNEFRVCGPGIMQCCLSNCGRTLYFVWHRIIEKEGDTVVVNLLLNRIATSAIVYSYLPYEGRVKIRMREQAKLMVRLPEWMDRESLKVSNMQGAPLTFSFDDDFVKLDSRPAGETVQLHFDLPRKEVVQQIGHLEARITFRGHEVIQFEPRGKDNPYWIHKRVEAPNVPENVKTYFVSDENYRPF